MEKIDAHQWMHILKAAEKVDGYDQYFFNRLWRELEKENFILPGKVIYSQESIEKRMEQAQAWLLALDFPEEYINKMSILTFLALGHVTPVTRWKDITNDHMSLSKDIMTFVGEKYNLKYKSNTRESFRRDGINPLLSCGIIELNPGNPNLGPNSPLTHYAIKKKVIEKIKGNGKG